MDSLQSKQIEMLRPEMLWPFHEPDITVKIQECSAGDSFQVVENASMSSNLTTVRQAVLLIAT